jgi:fumarate reductase subunit C
MDLSDLELNDSSIKKSKTPARLDFIQSASGLFLAIFMIGHMLFVSTILISKDLMHAVTKFFEGSFIIEGGEPLIVTVVGIFVISVLVVHAFIALRKFPHSFAEYKKYKTHMGNIKHSDTNKWFVQIITGFAMFFLASVHLYIIITQPENIGPFASADRVWTNLLWPLYLFLLVAVELHLSLGLYRLAIKWGWFDGDNPREMRKTLLKVKTVMTLFFLTLGLLTLLAYMKIGYDHKDNYGKKYIPTQGAKK